MSTRGLIARATGEGKFEGRYHGWDSYPHGLGVALVELYRGHFRRNLKKMLTVLLDEHPAGWSTIVNCDFKLKPGYTNVAERPEGMSFDEFHQKPLNRRPHCYCHGHRHEEGFLHDEKSKCDAEWAYVFEVQPAEDGEEPEQHIMHVLASEQHADSKEWYWLEVGRVVLNDDTQPVDWTLIECGEGFTRCKHVASYHNVTSPLSMRTYIGLEPLDPMHDAVAYIIAGKRYTTTGSGGNSDYYNSTRHAGFPPDCWIASLKTTNGHRVELPVARIGKDGHYRLLPNVQAVYPPVLATAQKELVTQ